jgi:NAD(P)-dependent dehydrogenase (short-subunit alcohol dehydrogenase family)
MTGRVEGKRIAVIGAGSVGPGWGNGKAAAVLFAREGGHVLCVDREAEAAAGTVGLIEAEGGAARALAADVTRQPDVEAVVAAMTEAWGGIDVLHFNVGISQRGGVAETSPDDWAHVFAVNLGAAQRVARAVLPLMQAQGAGALVFVSSVAALRAGPYSYAAYEASKAGLCRMSASIARQYAPFGVRSNTVVPGVIDTPHVAAFIAPDADPKAVAEARAAMVPMGRQGSAWDVARAALFLASDEAGYITGVDLRVDGGFAL